MIDVKVNVSKALQGNPEALARLEQPLAVAAAMAATIKERVAIRGNPASQYKSYATQMRAITTKTGATYQAKRRVAGSQRRRGYGVSPKYLTMLGIDVATRFDSSAEFHRRAGTKPGTFRVTSGMWDGLQVRNLGATAAMVEFARSSIGQSSIKTAYTEKVERGSFNGKAIKSLKGRTLKRTKEGKVVYRKSEKMIPNWKKAVTVFGQSQVHLLEPTDREGRDVSDAMQDVVAAEAVYLLGGELNDSTGGTHGALYARVMAALGRPRQRH